MRLDKTTARNPRNTNIYIGRCGSGHNARIEGIIDKIAPAFEINFRGCMEVTDDPNDVNVIENILTQYKSGIRTQVNNIISNDETVKQLITEYVNGTTLGRAPNLKSNTRAGLRAVWNSGPQVGASAQPAASPAPATVQPAAQPVQPTQPVVEPVKTEEVKAEPTPAVQPAPTPAVNFRLAKNEYRDVEKKFAENLQKGANFLSDEDLLIGNQPVIDLIDVRTVNSLLDVMLSNEKIPGTKKVHTITNQIYGAMMLATGDNDKADKFLRKTKRGTAKDEWELFLNNFQKYGTMLVAANGGLYTVANRLFVYCGKPSAGKDYIIEKLYPGAEKILMTGTKEAVDYVNPPKFVDGKGMDYVKGALVRIADKNGNHPSHIAYMPEANMAMPSVLKEMLQPLCDNSSIYKYGDGPTDFIEIHPDFKIIMSLNPISNSGSINVFEQPLISRMGRIYVYDIDADTATERAISKDNKGKLKSFDEFVALNKDLQADATNFVAEVRAEAAEKERQRQLAEQQRALNEAQAKLDAERAKQAGADLMNE